MHEALAVVKPHTARSLQGLARDRAARVAGLIVVLALVAAAGRHRPRAVLP